MEWVLFFAFCWWLVAAVFIVTVIFRTSYRKPETRSMVVKSSSVFERMQLKRFWFLDVNNVCYTETRGLADGVGSVRKIILASRVQNFKWCSRYLCEITWIQAILRYAPDIFFHYHSCWAFLLLSHKEIHWIFGWSVYRFCRSQMIVMRLLFAMPLKLVWK
jgi:hypothetical protein